VLAEVTALRYVTPLREGGSLPGVVEADDLGTYVVKFRGAGQGPKALVAEVIVGELARRLDLPMPALARVAFSAELGRAEPDPEVQELLLNSAGLNLGMDFLPGALPFSPVVGPKPDPALAAAVVWFDCFVTNVDRTPRNPNLLMWGGKLWLIDHGAALYIHHSWRDPEAAAVRPFAPVKDHILLPFAGSIIEADARLASLLTDGVLSRIIGAVPDEWLVAQEAFPTPEEGRRAYLEYLTRRLAEPRAFVLEAERVRAGA
jgi:hypothetical protein